MQLSPDEVNDVCDLVLELCGVCLDVRKTYLIENRLGRVLNRHGLTSYREMANRVRRASDLKLRNEIVDAITTHETLFFRDKSPFEAFKHKVLPELIDVQAGTASAKRLRIWSAAASTGQEPYSIAMAICEVLPDVATWDIQILATDISDACIAKASRGRYSACEIERGMPHQLLDRYFRQIDREWVVKDHLRSMIAFRKYNLLDSLTSLGQFDVVFCRNVAIYFTNQARKSLFERISKNLNTGGYLFVGSSELLTNLGPQYVPLSHCGSIYYQPNMSRQKSFDPHNRYSRRVDDSRIQSVADGGCGSSQQSSFLT